MINESTKIIETSKVLEVYRKREKNAVAKMVSAAFVSNKTVQAYKELVMRIEVLEIAESLIVELNNCKKKHLLQEREKICMFIEDITFEGHSSEFDQKHTSQVVISNQKLYYEIYQKNKNELFSKESLEDMLNKYMNYWLLLREQVVSIKKKENKNGQVENHTA